MRILIDECLDWRLCRALPEHYCASVQQKHWEGLTNGTLLEKAQTEFDVFLTGDTNLSFQQNLTKFNLAVIVLEASSTLSRYDQIGAASTPCANEHSAWKRPTHWSNTLTFSFVFRYVPFVANASAQPQPGARLWSRSLRASLRC